jgi:hypothetical protein
MATSRLAVAAIVVTLALGACGGGGLAPVTPSASPLAPTASTGNPSGALAGFLHAAAQQDDGQVLSWLATAGDAADLNQILKVYSDFGTSGGFFWEVEGLTATGERNLDPTHAEVALSGPIVWCLGAAPNDPTATCSAVNGVPGRQHTYSAISVAGEWKADVDVNASSGLDHNPRASPTATAPTPTP